MAPNALAHRLLRVCVAGMFYLRDARLSVCALQVRCAGDTINASSTDTSILVSSVASDVNSAPPCAEPATESCVKASDMDCYSEVLVPVDIDSAQHRIYALDAQHGSGKVVSMADDNYVFLNGVHIATLNKGERWTGAVNDFDEFAARGPIYGSVRASGEHVMASGRLKGRTFSFANGRRSPLCLWPRALENDTSCTVRIGDGFEQTTAISAGTGHVLTLNRGTGHSVAVVCDEDIVLAVGQCGGTEDYMVVPPETTEWYGVVSTQVCLSKSGADLLSGYESCSDGVTRTWTLSASSTPEGFCQSGYGSQYTGKACRYSATAPFSVHSMADGDGNAAVNLLPTSTGSMAFGASTQFQWLAFASLEAGTCSCSHGNVNVNNCANGVCKGYISGGAAGATCDCTVPMFGVLECAETQDEQLFYGDLTYEAQRAEETYIQGLNLCFHRSVSTMTWNECDSTCDSQGQHMLTGQTYENNSLVEAAGIKRAEGVWLSSLTAYALLRWDQRMLSGENGLSPLSSQGDAASPEHCATICAGVEGATGFQYGKEQEDGQCVCGFGDLSNAAQDSNWAIYGFEAECCCQSPHVDSLNVTVHSLGQTLASAVLTSETSISMSDKLMSATPVFGACTSPGIRLTDSGELIQGQDLRLSTTHDYLNSLRCYWQLTCSNPDAVVQLRFLSFDTETSYDFVYVKDGESHDQPGITELARLHGLDPSDMQEHYQSTGPNMSVHFHTDGASTRAGWAASFECIGADALATGPVRARYNDEGASSLYGLNRHDGLTCSREGPQGGLGNDLLQASTACQADPDCVAISDRSCNGADFTMCQSKTAVIGSSEWNCVYELPRLDLNVVLGPLANVSYLETQMLQVTFSDGFNSVSCDTPLVVNAPRLLSSHDEIVVSALITSVETTQVTITNIGTEDLVLRTGAPNGMSLLNPDGTSTSWAVATAMFDTRTMQAAGVDDNQLVLQPSASMLLSIECQGTAVAAEGTYHSELAIFSNDPVVPITRVPLVFTVNDYGLILIGLPETILASVAPASVTEYSQTVYNVYSGRLQWAIEATSEGCECDGQSQDMHPCRLSQSNDIAVELDTCDGTILPGQSIRVYMRLTAPQKAGSYQQSWKMEPTSGTSESFLRANVDMTVTPVLDDFLPSATSITKLSDGSTTVYATREFRLACTIYDRYGNEIMNNGLSGWSAIVNTLALEPVEALIEFDFAIRAEARSGVYATRPITAEQKGVYSVTQLLAPEGTVHTLDIPFALTVQPLACSPPRVLASEDGAFCVVQWCTPGNQPSPDQRTCVACEPGRFSASGIQCEICRNGTIALQAAAECSRCPAGSASNVDNTGCTRCQAGQQPDRWQSSCADCTAGRYSRSGHSCEICQPPFVVEVVGGRPLACDPCLPGTAPNENRTRCLGCDGFSYSSQGVVCESCEQPNVVDELHRTCSPCNAGQQPNRNRTSCDPCPPGKHSSFGRECAECPAGYTPDGTQVNCIDIDECANNDGDCDPIASFPRCTNTPGSRTCGRCPVGYVGSADRSNGATGCLLPEIDRSSSAAVQLQSSVELRVSAADLPDDDDAAQATFQQVVLQRLADAMGIDVSRIQLTEVVTASAGRRRVQVSDAKIVNFVFTIVTDVTGDVTPGDALQSLNDALQDNANNLFAADPEAGVDYAFVLDQTAEREFVCPAFMVRYADAAVCTWCGRGTEPNTAYSDCLNCPAGWAGDGRECAECEAGKQASADQGLCVRCPSDQFSAPGSSCGRCAPGLAPLVDQSGCGCAPGFFGTNSSCTACPVGKYSDVLGSTHCEFCAAGHSTVVEGASECQACTPGRYSDLFTKQQQLPCQACALGQYAEEDSSESCSACPIGTYSGSLASISASGCVNCRKGTIDDDHDPSTPCEDCPRGQSTRADQIAAGATSCMCLPGWYGVRTRTTAGTWTYTCAEGPGREYANCRELFDDDHSGHLWLQQQVLHEQEQLVEEYESTSPISAVPVLSPRLNETVYTKLRMLMSGLQPPETAACFTRNNLWYNSDQVADLLSENALDNRDTPPCVRPGRPKKCTLETCKPLLSYHLDLNKNDIQINSDKFATMSMYNWFASQHTCFSRSKMRNTTVPAEQLQTLESALEPFSSMKDRLYSDNGDPYIDEVKPYYDILAVSLAQPALSSGNQELCLLNICREGHEGHLCSLCKPGFAKQLSSGICYRCEGDDYTLWWRPPLMYFVIAWKMMRKSYLSSSLQSSKMTSFIFFFQTTALVSTGTNWFGQKQTLHPQLLEYLTTIKLYFNLEFDKTSRCPIDVYSRFYYDVFYTPAMVMVGLHMAFAVWWLFVKANSRFNLLGRIWSCIHAVSFGKCGKKQMARRWRTELKFHRYQAQRAQWLVYLYIYAPLTRKCSSVFFCRDDIAKGTGFMKSDISANCNDERYYIMWCFAVVMFTLVGLVIPAMIFWRLYYNPNHWHCHDDEQCIFSVDDYVAYRSPRVFFSNLNTSVAVDVDAQLADFAPGTTQRAALEREVIEQVSSLFNISADRISLIGVRKKRAESKIAKKQGHMQWLDRSEGEGRWKECSVRLDGDVLSWRSTMMVPGNASGEESTTVPTSISLWKDRTDTSVDDRVSVGDHGYRFEVVGADMEAHHFAANEDTERLAWIEAIHDVLAIESHARSKVTLLESSQVRSSAASSSAECLTVHCKISTIQSEDHDRTPSESPADHRQISGAELDSIEVAGCNVRCVRVSKSGPVVGPLPLRRVARMLSDGTIGFETRLRVATSSDWITKSEPKAGHTIDTIDKLIIHSRDQRNARPIDIYTDLNEYALVQELNWLVAQQSEVAASKTLLKSLAHGGAKALKEDSRHQIERTLRALCFCTRARVVKVADNAERFKVEVSAGDEDQQPLCYWYSRRVLQNIGLPLQTVKERILLKKGLPLNAIDSSSASNMLARLDNMELSELHRYALTVGVEDCELLSGIDINAASREELSAALKDDQLAAAIYDTAEHTQIDNEADARLHIRGFREHHALALTRAGIRYPALGFFDNTMSFHPALKKVHDKDRIKDLGELTVEERM